MNYLFRKNEKIDLLSMVSPNILKKVWNEKHEIFFTEIHLRANYFHSKQNDALKEDYICTSIVGKHKVG
jgi:hypothetical protein